MLDLLASTYDIKTTFGYIAIDYEETIALIASGYAFGKTYGTSPSKNLGVEPNASLIEV